MSGRKVRSAKGEIVDFDLIKIKEQMATMPPPVDVKVRQNHIDQRLKRRLRKAKSSPIKPTKTEVNVNANMPKVNQTVNSLIEEDKKIAASKPKTKQKARSKTKKK